MLLTIDIGNSRTDVGLYSGNELVRVFHYETSIYLTANEYRHRLSRHLDEFQVSPEDIREAIIASVVSDLNPVWERVVFDLFDVRPRFVNLSLSGGLGIAEGLEASDLGADIIAACVGALSKYGSNCVVADLGTASKLIHINEKGEFGGLSIGPGLRMSSRALRADTAALPEVRLTKPERAIGKNTKECLLSGIVYGAAMAVKGLSSAFEEEAASPLTKILTGGNAPHVVDLLPEFKFDETLVLDGLRVINERSK